MNHNSFGGDKTTELLLQGTEGLMFSALKNDISAIGIIFLIANKMPGDRSCIILHHFGKNSFLLLIPRTCLLLL